MKTPCNSCRQALSTLVYESIDDSSITTMNTRMTGKTRVFFCEHCGHLQTAELFDQQAYYADEYDINSKDEDEDQLYKIVDGVAVFRAQHQLAVLRSKIDFDGASKVLDFGCAKAPTLRKLMAEFPNIEPHLYDLTDRYVPFWEKFPRKARYAVRDIPADWRDSMDVVLSFYALEHAGDLTSAFAAVRTQLKPGGIFYFVVPNVFTNVADLIVADHPNHFTEASLKYVLEAAGFENVQVDGSAHDGAYCVMARKAVEPAPTQFPQDIQDIKSTALAMGEYWRSASGRVREYEAAHAVRGPLAIYGAGFYANFLLSCLADPDGVRCLVDRNVQLQGTIVQGKPVIAPEALPPGLGGLLVGLNPRIARQAIDEIDNWDVRELEPFFL
jgi:SAM-dependent methyltransferase